MITFAPVGVGVGRTTYKIEPEGASTAKLTRVDGDETIEVLFPRSLLRAYAQQWARKKALEFMSGEEREALAGLVNGAMAELYEANAKLGRLETKLEELLEILEVDEAGA